MLMALFTPCTAVTPDRSVIVPIVTSDIADTWLPLKRG